ncbi:MAG TPA: ComEA family DNA-binding protein [Geopsychrobacteraceae bacterium]|jgi:competence protein ComEA
MIKRCAKILCVVLLALAIFCQPVLAQEKININKASVEQLVELKGIGEKTALKIVEYREQQGEFASVDALVNVKGVGSKTLDKIRDRLTVTEDLKQ